MFDGRNFWLLKPTDFNRGRGVQVFNTIEQFKKLLNEYQQGVEVRFDNNSKACPILPDVQVKKTQSTNNVCATNTAQVPTGNQPYQIPPEQMLTNFTNLDNVPNIVKTDAFVV